MNFLPIDVAIPFGISFSGKLLHISKVSSGLDCNCFCPACHEPLVAKKGGKIQHHFAHKSDRVCSSGFETAIHLFSKELIASNKILRLPRLQAYFYGTVHTFRPEKTWNIDQVRLEQWLDGIRPDIICDIQGHPLAVEIFVTHRSELKKIEELNKRKLPAIEIDLSKFQRTVFDAVLLQQEVIESAPRSWLFHPAKQLELEKLQIAYDAKIVEEMLEECKFLDEWARWEKEQFEKEKMQIAAKLKEQEEAAIAAAKAEIILKERTEQVFADVTGTMGEIPAKLWIEATLKSFIKRTGPVTTESVDKFTKFCNSASFKIEQKIKHDLIILALAKVKSESRTASWLQTVDPSLGGTPLEICLRNNGINRCRKSLERFIN